MTVRARSRKYCVQSLQSFDFLKSAGFLIRRTIGAKGRGSSAGLRTKGRISLTGREIVAEGSGRFVAFASASRFGGGGTCFDGPGTGTLGFAETRRQSDSSPFKTDVSMTGSEGTGGGWMSGASKVRTER